MLTLAVGVTSATATLPSVSLLSGEEFPVTIEGKSGEAKIETVLKTAIICTGSSEKFSIASGGSLGTYSKDFTGCKLGTTPCNTDGDAAETLLLTGEVHLVPVSAGSLTFIRILYLTAAPFNINCGKMKIKAQGPLIGSFNGTLGSDITSFKSKLAGSGGKQELTSYFNNEEKEVTKSLMLLNFGLGNENADLAISGETTYTSSKMIIIS
ncbi:MAG TPA: hypothetical protein VHW67_14180 [Solirubrobacteraceae bacterium]|nr:hypothetical protein [Solirubrobacteraceae bacterium]